MFNLFSRFWLSILVLILVNLSVFSTHSAIAEIIKNPMQPPAFALNKFRLAKLKKNGTSQAKPTIAKKIAKKSLRLSAILIGNDRKVAIINDRMLVIGDKIDRSRVIKIFKDRVEISRNGKKFELKLDKDLTAIRKRVVKSKL